MLTQSFTICRRTTELRGRNIIFRGYCNPISNVYIRVLGFVGYSFLVRRIMMVAGSLERREDSERKKGLLLRRSEGTT